MIQINWKPDKSSGVKKQIVDYMRQKINSGAWPIGTVLPAQRKLAESFKVNRSTIVIALDILKADGLIEGRGRAGMIVKSSTVPLMALSQARWKNYIDDGIHLPNYKTIKMINDSDPDTSMLRLSSGEISSDMFPNLEIKKIMNKVSNDMSHLGYEWPTGMLALRQALCAYLGNKGISAKPENILIVSGALQGFQLITMGLLQTGSTVFVEKPSYLYSLQILQTLGMRRIGIPMDELGILTKEIPDKIPAYHASILYTIPNYQNPTGRVMSAERRHDLMKICYEHQMPIIEDDVYGELWIDECPPPSLKSQDEIGNVLYVGSVSKTLSPGLRIGWVVGPEPVISRLADIKMQMDYGSSSISQMIVAECLSSGFYDRHLIEIRSQLKKRRDYTIDILNTFFSSFASWEIPKGGFYIWIELKEQISMYKLFELAYNDKILFNPGYIYESSGNHALRISYVYAPLEDIKKGLVRLSEIIKTLLS